MTSDRGASSDHESGRSVAGGTEELLYRNERTRVLRAWLPDRLGSVIVKEPRGPGAAARQRHEISIIKRLEGIDGVPRLADLPGYAGTIVIDDAGGRSLATILPRARLDVTTTLAVAATLVRTVAEVHRRGVVHRDINPANIVVGGDPWRLQLIDFDLASTSAEERPGFTHQSQVAGTLPYLAPEQTGRTGRPVDQRADLYSLGATLYALATGVPPFGDGEPLELIHAHLARVPRPATDLNPAVPRMLSEIILRLLEKEPDRRYQSADGLGYDLSRLLPDGNCRDFPLGERDFPLRLAPPSRLVGRAGETTALRAAFDAACAGGGPAVLVSGAPGVGKTALIDELRPVATAVGGWFVTGKFDQYRRGAGSDGVRQALRGLGRLLLAEPEGALTGHRVRLLESLGSNAGLVATLLPEFALFLEVPPTTHDATDVPEIDASVVQAELEVLRSIASPSRPVVIVLDDLQWAETTSIGFVDAVVMADDLAGVLLVGAYRDDEVDAAHPLATRLARWQRSGRLLDRLALRNLPPTELRTLVGEMLRMTPTAAAGLVAAVAERTGGNPYETVELINWLRDEGVLTPGERDWSWDATVVRGYLGRGEVTDLIRARLDRLPRRSRAVLQTMACLGGEVGLELLRAAAGVDAEELERQLRPALEDGLLVLERRGEGAVRFRHDRIQQAVYDGMGEPARRDASLALARRLARHPGLGAVAAERYLAAVGAIRHPEERRYVAALFQTTAAQASLANPVSAERFLTAAIDLVTAAVPAGSAAPAVPGAGSAASDGAEESRLLAALEIDRHAALYRLGRLDEADDVYKAIERSCPRLLDRIDAACLQISSLSNRNRSLEALELGLDLLHLLGVTVPQGARLTIEIDHGLDALYRWIEDDDRTREQELRQPDVTDPRLLAIAKLINRALPAAFFTGHPVLAWLVVQAWRLWTGHGPCAPLVGPLSHAGFVTAGARQDFRVGYRILRWVLTTSEARGYEPQTSQARFLFALGTGHWFDRLRDNIAEARRAHEGLQRRGDLQNACCTYYASIPQLLDCAPTVDGFIAEAEAGIAYAVRSGNDQAEEAFLGYRQLGRALRGETGGPGSFDDETYTEACHLAVLTANPTAAANFHTSRALAALVFGDVAALISHAAAAAPLRRYVTCTYAEWNSHLLQALALAARARAAGAEERLVILAELDENRYWLSRRSADAPQNFSHLLRLVDAERAWAAGHPWAAVGAFDAAMREVMALERPLHHALITERAARFHLAHRLERTGRNLLAEARLGYRAWGASGKVAQLDADKRYQPAQLRSERDISPRSVTISVSSDTIDLYSILKASQALSSQTSLEQLRIEVVEVLSAMTGATAVRVLLWSDNDQGWIVPEVTDDDGVPIPVDQAVRLGLLPFSAFLYAERTREPLLVEDATRDDRFARDPYLVPLETCSLLVVPIITRGALRAMLILENRLSHGAFSPQRLDTVELLAGQLAVSLDNALVYASLEQKVTERTEALKAANEQLATLSRTDPLTGLANRRRLEETLASQWRTAAALAHPVGLAMIDIDHFKAYNDRYGHVSGDRCLRSVASVLGQHVRNIDMVARYGGEEFAIILPEADAAAAHLIAERVRTAVIALGEPHAGASTGVVTVSIGVASMVPGNGTSAELLIERADAQLYRAKHNGRNQVSGGSAGYEATAAVDYATAATSGVAGVAGTTAAAAGTASGVTGAAALGYEAAATAVAGDGADPAWYETSTGPRHQR